MAVNALPCGSATAALHVAHPRRGGRQADGLSVNCEHARGLRCEQRRAAGEEGVYGIDAVYGRVPCLGAFLMEQPAAHLVCRQAVVGRHRRDGFDGGHHRGYAVVAPRVACPRGVVIAPCVVGVHGVLLQALHILAALLPLAALCENDGSECLVVDSLALYAFLEQAHEVVGIALGLG